MNVKLAKFIDRYLVAATLFVLYPYFTITRRRNNRVKNIAIVRIWTIGESILVLPLIKRLKNKFPESKIKVVCTDKNKLIFENKPYIDEVITINGLNILKYFNKFDITIDTEPFMNLATLISAILGKTRYGYKDKKFSKLFTNSFKYNDKIHAADNFLILGSELGIDLSKIINLEKLSEKTQSSSLVKKPIIGICITTGPTASPRKWPIEKWLNLCNKLIKDYNPTIAIIAGPSDKEEIGIFRSKLNYSNVVDTTNMSLNESINLISNLDLMISLDTGPMHMSAAQGIPTIGLFCPNSPVRFGPLGPKNSFIYKPVIDKPCINVHLGQVPDCKNHNHMSNITEEDVYRKIKSLNLKL